MSVRGFRKALRYLSPLAGISTVKEIKNNPFDIKATGKLNKLYVELLRDNPDWATEAKRPALNQFIARLIFCFFAEDTGIFLPKQFTKMLELMSDGQSGNTHEILCELFRAMDLKPQDREAAKVKSWADKFPYVNGGMFAGGGDCPKFSKVARSYLLAVGGLEWDKINPDIFGSMIQAVADDDERGELGMHYTSVPNILKVLNPLFLDDLREHLQSAEDNLRKLRNLRKRLASIRVFDPACGSGNFLVIAYKEMRSIEHEIVRRTGDEPRSWIKLENFYGIEIKNFAVEIARLALLIAEFQSDVQYISQQEARAMVLPLHKTGQIRVGNALRQPWNEVCPPAIRFDGADRDSMDSTGRLASDDDTGDKFEIETYVCGNPPYKGSQSQTDAQKDDLESVFEGTDIPFGSADYVVGWFVRAAQFVKQTAAMFAFVTTNSIHQGRQVARFWPFILGSDLEIFFAEPSFKWHNLATKKAVVMVSVIGVRHRSPGPKRIFDGGLERQVQKIGPYLVPDTEIVVAESKVPLSALPQMNFGSMPNDGGALLLNMSEARDALACGVDRQFIRRACGTEEFINGIERRCIWVTDRMHELASKNAFLKRRFDAVEAKRRNSTRAATAKLASVPYRFGEVRQTGREEIIIVAKTSSETRDYLPVSVLSTGAIVTEAFGIFDSPLWNLSLIASRLHLVWIATVCGKMKRDFRYSNTLGWNTFPVPPLTDHNKEELNRCAEEILLARESHFPSTIADLYDPEEEMPDDLRRAHERNDEVVERIYIGRRFRNDTERLVKLFDLYSKMTTEKPQTKKKAKRAA
ncbi:DNA methyltransferase [Bradyrhizobium betae]|uniref:DNA methyltransferase n=1 Tax=Bradyrhizobium betae TaxID=244734 RepID=UPI003D677BEA